MVVRRETRNEAVGSAWATCEYERPESEMSRLDREALAG
jgi:hypothetical protein